MERFSAGSGEVEDRTVSRIGKLALDIPDKVEVVVEGTAVRVKGPKGQLDYSFPGVVKIEVEGRTLKVSPLGGSAFAGKSMWGTTRTLIGNMVQGVSTGFTKRLEFNGIGYKVLVKGNVLNLNLGYSHPIDYRLPEGVTAKVDKNIIEISGCDKGLVGFVAAKVRSFRPPEPYKGKGIKYVGETIVRKAGKTGGKK